MGGNVPSTQEISTFKERQSIEQYISNQSESQQTRTRLRQLTLHDKYGKDESETKRYQEISSLWGDNPDIKEEGTLRITGTNINGLIY